MCITKEKNWSDRARGETPCTIPLGFISRYCVCLFFSVWLSFGRIVLRSNVFRGEVESQLAYNARRPINWRSAVVAAPPPPPPPPLARSTFDWSDYTAPIT